MASRRGGGAWDKLVPANISKNLIRRAEPYQRILVFVGANETGGHAYLYRMLQTTKHPLYIVYACRRPRDSTVPFVYVQKSPEIAKALAETDSTMSFYEVPAAREVNSDWLDKARRPISKCSDAHGERPISYIFINGHENFGWQQDLNENASARQLRLEKYWAPYKGALTTAAKPDAWNPFDHQVPYVTTKSYVSQMSSILTSLLPLVRNDGEGVVVLKSPSEGSIELVKSQQMRANFVNPTPHFYQSAVLSMREAVDRLMNRKKLSNSPWPRKRDFLRLGDVFAKSAIMMYKSFTPFENITFHTCSHDYDDLNGPVQLLLDPDVPKPEGSMFTKKELDAASKRLPTDIDAGDAPEFTSETIIRRTTNPPVLPHNRDRGTRGDWLEDHLVGGPKAVRPSPVRSVFSRLQIDEGVTPNRYTPFDQRVNPPIANPKPDSKKIP
ncbi:hypothetical protein TWF281_004535 [Arthrobotrys megalospora]